MHSNFNLEKKKIDEDLRKVHYDHNKVQMELRAEIKVLKERLNENSNKNSEKGFKVHDYHYKNTSKPHTYGHHSKNNFLQYFASNKN